MAARPTRLVGAITGTVLALGVMSAPPALAASGNPSGTHAGSQANGSGYLKVSLSATADGKILVRWRAPGGASSIRRYVVRVGPNRALDSKVHGYAVSRTRRSIVVPRAFGVTPYSGNFSFVKVTVQRRGGAHTGSPTKWIQGPVAGCTTSNTVRVGTFNVRTWRADSSDRKSFRWSHRGPRVVRQILHSGASVVAIQEASGAKRPSSHGLRQDRWLLQRLNATDPDRSARWADVLPQDAYHHGLVGTRVFYDASKVTLLTSGVTRLTVPRNGLSFAAWGRFQEVGGQTPFVMVSTHLANGNGRRVYRQRGAQAQKLAAFAGDLQRRFGGQVFVAGDMNSTTYSKPFNNVQQTLLKAGLYDAFATPHIANSRFPTTNDFTFPTRRTPHRRDYIFTLGPVKGSCSYRNYAYARASRVASDHFMQDATLPLS